MNGSRDHSMSILQTAMVMMTMIMVIRATKATLDGNADGFEEQLVILMLDLYIVP